MKVLFTGSREIAPEQADTIRRYITERVAGKDVHIIVGDAEGADTVVIQACDESDISIEVHGAYNKMRCKTWTGKNYPHDTDYLGRDRIMAEMVGQGDMVVVAWNGKSKRSGTYATARYASKNCPMAYWLLEKPE